jgi:cephalosporin hydroxylase
MKRPDNNLTPEQWTIVDAFHNLLYNRPARWLGYPIIKNPMDLIIYQELINETRPDTIIECGTGGGGSTLFFASIMALLGTNGHIISIDTNADVDRFYKWAFPLLPDDHPLPRQRPEAPGIMYLTANSVAPSTIRRVQALAEGRVMVVLDSAHTTQHVLDECELYGPLVSDGCYLVVEDINICGHPVPMPDWPDGGPYDAVEIFLKDHAEFVWDPRWVAHYLLSYHAWLRRRPEEPMTS